MKLLPLLLLASAFFTSSTAFSATDDASDKNIEKLRQALAISMPQVQPTKISRTPIEGLYEVVVGSQVVYMSVDSRYMIEGDLYDLKTKKNISEGAKSAIRLAVIDKLGEENMLIYKPEKVKNVITVITDIDCPYCRKLHSEIDEYMKNDVEVRYIFMPLKGSSDMRKTISVWCSDDPQLALDMAKAGSEIEQKTCDNPIKQHLAVARELGVRGTPAILLESGELLPGYVPAKTLISEIRK